MDVIKNKKDIEMEKNNERLIEKGILINTAESAKNINHLGKFMLSYNA